MMIDQMESSFSFALVTPFCDLYWRGVTGVEGRENSFPTGTESDSWGKVPDLISAYCRPGPVFNVPKVYELSLVSALPV